jgi:hypothetical protein
MTYPDTYVSAQQAMHQPFDECRGQSIDLSLEQGIGTDLLLMTSSISEPRFIDSVDDDIDVPPGGRDSDREEFEPPIAELAALRTLYCAELARLLKTDVHGLMQEQVFQNRDLIAETFLTNLTE